MPFQFLEDTKLKLAEKVKRTKDLIKEIYLADERPWVVGYSGGKDSTCVVQLVFEALSELDRNDLRKKVYVISSDTRVETPLIISFIHRTLMRIQERSFQLGLPIETHKVQPRPEESFWALLIGKGYPSPRQKFRWCTDRLKIDPANRFIKDKVSQFGEVIMVLGVRETESGTRAQVMKSHSVEGKSLMRHSTLPNSFVFAPIRDFSTDDVWEYLLNYPSPWGNDNHALLQLYQNSNSECPLIIDEAIKESAGSCGNSRFGCWVCTVVQQDKALAGFIDNGEEWLKPMLHFRNWLYRIRDVRKYRQKRRMDGKIYFIPVKVVDKKVQNVHIDEDHLNQEVSLDKFKIIKESELEEYLKENNIDLATVEDLNLLIEDENGQYKQLGLGPFTLQARKMILRKLLETQKAVQPPDGSHIELISVEDLKKIRQYWFEDGDWKDELPIIFREVMGFDLDWEDNDQLFFQEDQLTDLQLLCQEYNVSFELIKQLIAIEMKHTGYKVRRGIYQEFDRILKQDWLQLANQEGNWKHEIQEIDPA